MLLEKLSESNAVAVPPTASNATPSKRALPTTFDINRSPLAFRIVVLNLVTVLLMGLGIIYLTSARDSFVQQREMAMITEATLIADRFQLAAEQDGALAALSPDGSGADVLVNFAIPSRESVFIYNARGKLISSTSGVNKEVFTRISGTSSNHETPMFWGLFEWLRDLRWFGQQRDEGPIKSSGDSIASALVQRGLNGELYALSEPNQSGSVVSSVVAPIRIDVAGSLKTIGVVGVLSNQNDVDSLVGTLHKKILHIFAAAALVSIVLSLVLASTIASPLADLAAAADMRRDAKNRSASPERVHIPDLSGHSDEIGRLSTAMRDMVAALHDRIDANEQFASDVAHELKNPLASLRSAVGSLRIVKKEEHRQKLFDVLDHDVRRMDRLVSDISNASRLDSELVKEDEEQFDLVKTLGNLAEYMSQGAKEQGVEFIVDLPRRPVFLNGLEARLAQVFVNLIANATSFCDEGDAVKIWARKRGGRVLIVVEDTGRGIPEGALSKVFERFYSERPEGQFGNNSGLGLAISKQIVEAHGGVIWAENICPHETDITSDPLGARFVVGLPV